MGSFLSLASDRTWTSQHKESSLNATWKRQRTSLEFGEDNSRLIPSLPDEISIRIFSRLPRICYFSMKLVARNWKEAIMSPELFKLRKELGTTEEWLYLLSKVEDDKLFWHALDPVSKKWQRLPPIPNVIFDEESRKGISGLWTWNVMGSNANIADVIRQWLGRKDASEQLPYSGCSIGAVGGCLYVLGGFSKASAMSCVWRYDPVPNEWIEVPSMSARRAYCKASILNDKLYVVGGVSQGQGGLIPLQSAEVFDPSTDTWSQVPSMPFSQAQGSPTPFIADMLKPIATGMTSYRGKLCVPQSLYSWPFFVDVGGEIYDPEKNTWDEMPIGMGEGWPAKQTGTKLSVVVDEELYAFDPSSSLNNGKIKVYDQNEDAWKVAIERVPICDLAESESPYLLAGFHGKLHFITRDSNQDVTVLQADVGSTSSSFSTSSSCKSGFFHESTSALETVVWKVIARRNFGSSELVNCEVLNI